MSIFTYVVLSNLGSNLRISARALLSFSSTLLLVSVGAEYTKRKVSTLLYTHAEKFSYRLKKHRLPVSFEHLWPMGERRSGSTDWSTVRGRNDINVKVVWEAIQRMEASAQGHDEITFRSCTRCSKQAKKVCEECREALYCCRRCQKKDWHIHRNDCKKISIVVKTKGGESLPVSDLPLRTSLHDIRKKVYGWACAMMPSDKNDNLYDQDFEFNFMYCDRIIFKESTTLSKLRMKDGEELIVVAECERPPPLIDSSSSGHEW